jgi:c-di-GMP-related signal transduction protein
MLPMAEKDNLNYELVFRWFTESNKYNEDLDMESHSSFLRKWVIRGNNYNL